MLCCTLILIYLSVATNDDPRRHSNCPPQKPIFIPSSLADLQANDHLPKLARTIYLILCENQAEVDTYARAFPSITADVIYLCWRERCRVSPDVLVRKVFVRTWPHRTSRNASSRSGFSIRPRAWVINELDLGLTYRTTWTLARNLLLERALEEEHYQGWRWAYFNFLDGDVQINCPLANEILTKNVTEGDALIFVQPFRDLVRQTINEDRCFLLFDVFLLTSAPAIGTVDNMGPPVLFFRLFAQIVYHIDAMFNGFHRDAISFLLPYCPRYDCRTWWTSQAILTYRSLCLYGHSIQFNSIRIARQTHRPYPRRMDPFVMDNDMNLVPKSLINLKHFMSEKRTVSALVLQHYPGWSYASTSQECQQLHSLVDLRTCEVIDRKTRIYSNE